MQHYYNDLGTLNYTVPPSLMSDITDSINYSDFNNKDELRVHLLNMMSTLEMDYQLGTLDRIESDPTLQALKIAFLDFESKGYVPSEFKLVAWTIAALAPLGEYTKSAKHYFDGEGKVQYQIPSKFITDLVDCSEPVEIIGAAKLTMENMSTDLEWKAKLYDDPVEQMLNFVLIDYLDEGFLLEDFMHVGLALFASVLVARDPKHDRMCLLRSMMDTDPLVKVLKDYFNMIVEADDAYHSAQWILEEFGEETS